MEKSHSLLRRQIKKHFGSRAAVPGEFADFLGIVNDAYIQSDVDRQMLERSLDLSSTELLEANAELSALFQALPDLVFRLDRDGVILDVKAGAGDDLYLEPSRLVGRRVQDAPVVASGAPLAEVIERVATTQKMQTIDYSLHIRGKENFYEARLVPFLFDQFILIVRNVTDRKRAEEALRLVNSTLEQRVTERTNELEQTNRKLVHEIAERKREEDIRRRIEEKMLQTQKLEGLGVLAEGIAHDFNNLLMGVLGNASMIRMSLTPPSPNYAKIAEIESSANRAAELTNQMLAYSGRGRFVVQLVNLPPLVRDMANLLGASISKKARIEFDFPADLPPIEADATQVRQIVMNLITNASDALEGASGAIDVKAHVKDVDRDNPADTYLADELPEGRYVFLEVKDTGCGMDEETQKKVFDPFFTTKFTGRGLGLAAVLGIVRSHKGAIHLDSEPGRGSKFTVMFPAADRPAELAQPDVEIGVPDHWRGRGTVLVIDDDQTVLAVMRSMLEGYGFMPLLADGGPHGLETFGRFQQQIDCVFLDLSMPEMEGPEVFGEIHRVSPGTPVVLMSGYAEEEAVQRFAGSGLAGFLHKPFQADALARQLQRIFA